MTVGKIEQEVERISGRIKEKKVKKRVNVGAGRPNFLIIENRWSGGGVTVSHPRQNVKAVEHCFECSSRFYFIEGCD